MTNSSVGEPFEPCQDVLVTGRLFDPPADVVNLRAQVSSIYPKGHAERDWFKVWPADDRDPQLPKGHDGKLWFKRSSSTVVVVSLEEADVWYPRRGNS